MTWIPRSGREELAGCVWLGRYIDKARRHHALAAKRGDLLGDYMFGENDFLDAQLLKFLALRESTVGELIRNEPDDEKAARAIIETSGKSFTELQAFNRAFARRNAPFLVMMDADEDRMQNASAARLLKALYNGVLVPPATLAYRLARKRPEPLSGT